MNLDELRRSARQYTSDSQNVSKESAHLEERANLAADLWRKLLIEAPNDLEATFCLAYCEAVGMVDVANEHQAAAEKVTAAVTLVMEGLDQINAPDQSHFELLKTIADCTICLARRMNEQGALAELMGFAMFVSMGMDDDEKVESTIVGLSDEFANNVGMLRQIFMLMHPYWKKHPDDTVKAAAIAVGEAVVELMKESPAFLSDEPADFVFTMAEYINAMEPERFYCIPEPEYKYCDFEVLATFRKMLKSFYAKGETCKRVRKYNKEMREKKDAYFTALRQQKIDAYWAEHPGMKEELQSKLEAAQSRVEELDEEIGKLNKAIAKKRKDCLDAPIPAEKTKAELSDKLYQLRRYFGTLGIFKGKEKKRVQEEMASVQTQLEEANKTIERAKKENQRRAEEETREDKQKLAELKRQREVAHTELCDLRMKLEDPTV